MDLSSVEGGSRAAERWWGHDGESPKERAPPPNIAKGVGLNSVCLHPPCVSLWADGDRDSSERKGVREDEEAHFVVDRGADVGIDDVVWEHSGVC
jgi:hypothetical protein